MKTQLQFMENAYFIPVNITEDAVELVAWKFSESSGPGGMTRKLYRDGF